MNAPLKQSTNMFFQGTTMTIPTTSVKAGLLHIQFKPCLFWKATDTSGNHGFPIISALSSSKTTQSAPLTQCHQTARRGEGWSPFSILTSLLELTFGEFLKLVFREVSSKITIYPPLCSQDSAYQEETNLPQ